MKNSESVCDSQERVAVVVGGAGGIGRGILESLSQQCSIIIAADRDPSALDSARTAFKTLSLDLQIYEMDVSQQESVGAVFVDIIAEYGRIDILVNCVGIASRKTMADSTIYEWETVIDTNLLGMVRCVKATLPHMITQGSGCIIGVSSAIARFGLVGRSAYFASKVALEKMIEVLAMEVGHFGIRVNAIAPGFVATELTAGLVSSGDEQAMNAKIRTIPIGRAGTPEDMGHAVAFLASDKAAFITGQTLAVNGGQNPGMG